MNRINGRESGRSMVEMLGVLALVGLLSIMGIAAFNSAMTKHKASTLINEATKRAVTVAGQLGLGLDAPNLSDFSTESESFGTFDPVVERNATQFTLTVTGVNEAVLPMFAHL